MQAEYLMSVDGGGTQCRTRLTDRRGGVLAECQGGAANIYSDFAAAMRQVAQLLDDTLRAAGLPPQTRQRTSVALGLAGANVQAARQQAQAYPNGFARWQVASDVETACLGAHQGRPGAVLIVGTGSQGTRWDGRRFRCLGGWGLTLSDQGSGARLGVQALRLALQAHEGLLPTSELTDALMARFEHSTERLLRWSGSATPADWGQFSPLIFTLAARQDSAALQLIRTLADEIALMLRHLTRQGEYAVSLMGGLARPVLPWLPADVQNSVTPPQGDALDGALQLAANGR